MSDTVSLDLLSYSLQILLMSMKDMNIAKLSAVDLPLFNGIIQDLFPGVDTPTIDYGKVRSDRATNTADCDTDLNSDNTIRTRFNLLHPVKGCI